MKNFQKNFLKWGFMTLAMIFSCNAAIAKDNKPVELKVMSYNIRNGEAADGTNSWKYRYGATMEMLKDQQPDIFGVQEAYEYQVQAILDFVDDYKAVGVGREDGKKAGEFMSIFYNKKKLKVRKWGTFWLSETPDKPSLGWDGAYKRTATWALMKDKKSGKRFYFVNTHLDHIGPIAQKNGLALIVKYIAKMNTKNLPVVLTGDFNVELDNPCLKSLDGFMKNTRYTAMKSDDSGSFNGWGKTKPRLPIDYIFYQGFSSCLVFEVVDQPYANRQFISDHFPVRSVLVF